MEEYRVETWHCHVSLPMRLRVIVVDDHVVCLTQLDAAVPRLYAVIVAHLKNLINPLTGKSATKNFFGSPTNFVTA